MIGRFLPLALLGSLLGALPTPAQDVQRLDPDKAKQLARHLTTATTKLGSLPVRVVADSAASTGLTAKKVAILVVPDAKLSAAALQKLDKEVLPVGLLYAHKVTPVVAEEAVPADQHRTVEVTIKDQTVTVAVLPLAATRVAGRLVLLVYTNGKTPTLVTELVDIDEKQEQPLELEARPVGNNRATLLINVLGRYRAALPVTGQE